MSAFSECQIEHSEVHTVAILGTGLIGASWASLCLAKGLDVVGYDPAPGAEYRLRATIDSYWPILEELGLSENASVDRLTFEHDPARAVSRADFVQENGPERESAKVEIIRTVQHTLAQHAIIASSSSMLEVTSIQRQVECGDRVVLGHPFYPPHLLPLVEVVGGEHGSLQSVDAAMAFYRRLDRKPILLKREIKGHIGNRLQAALFKEAFHLAETGVASTSDIDLAIAHGPGLRWAFLGPFLNLHLAGGDGGIRHTFDHMGTVIDTLWRDAGNPQWTEALQTMIATQVDQQLADRSNTDIQLERDRLLAGLLRAKLAARALP